MIRIKYARDTTTPFDRKPGDPPALTERDIKDITAFLHTLDDGYMARPEPAAPQQLQSGS